ncbi:MAG: NUDIX domain-containing protein [Phycisphaeraceae bacterium]|nr:NUDIX domain-containing protein [Phycisphaeraceae bacterium]
MPGPQLATDIVDVYVFRRAAAARDVAFLQLRRAEAPMIGTWMPVIGHIHEGETATAAALRELEEETGFAPGQGLLGLWSLQSPNIYYLADIDRMMLGPCFAAEVNVHAVPRLNREHDDCRWIPRDHADRAFLWPGQRDAVKQVVRDILDPDSPVADILRVSLG